MISSAPAGTEAKPAMADRDERADTPGELRQFERPSYLDTWGRPSFIVEEYAFKEPLIKKHADVQFWAGNQIGFLTQAAIEELVSRGRSTDEAISALKKNLRGYFHDETTRLLAEHEQPPARDARTAGHLFMRWEAALGVPGEIMVNSPDLFIRRFYDAGDWYRLSSPEVLRVILEGQGEGISKAVDPALRFRLTRIAKAGDAFDEWEIMRIHRSDGQANQSQRSK
jgi:hypothetical protein